MGRYCYCFTSRSKHLWDDLERVDKDLISKFLSSGKRPVDNTGGLVLLNSRYKLLPLEFKSRKPPVAIRTEEILQIRKQIQQNKDKMYIWFGFQYLGFQHDKRRVAS